MSKNSFYKKVIVSVTGATLLSVGLNQVPNNIMSSAPTEVSAAQKTKVIGANSAVYKQTGKKVIKTKKIIKVGKRVRVYGQKTINGKLYYKIGKNQYIKASNVDAKKRQAAKNTVLYTRSGKVIKNSKVRKGQGVKIYGGQVTIKGKKYYSTKYGYIKVSALVGKAQPVEPDEGANDNTQDSTAGNGSTSNATNTSTGSTTPSTSAVDALKDKKAAANTEVKKAAEDAINAIKTSPLSADDQKAAIDRVNKIAQAAADTINNAQSEAAINAAKDSAIAASKLEPSKIESTDLASKAGEFVTNTAGGDATKVKAAVDKAKEAIAKAATKDDLDKAEAALQNDLNDVVPFAKQKEAAVSAIKATAQAAKDKINSDTSLSDDDKATATASIDAVVAAALEKVDDKTPSAIEAAETTGDLASTLNAIQAVCDKESTNEDSLKDKKTAASAAIDDAVTDATNAINNSPLSNDDKSAAISKIDQIAQDAKDSIENAKSEQEITDAQTAAVAACQLEPSRIESADLATKAGEFVTKAGGDSAKVTAAVNKAKETIANAKTQADLDKAETDLQSALNEAVPFEKQQTAAVNAINEAAKAGKDRYNNDPLLSEDEKEAANAAIDAIVESSLSDVKSATKASDLVTAVNTVQAACAQVPTDSETTR
ncbi:DUF1542 domain-containing protein [Lactobacillus apis]|uniref:DUF1542 domain-containing protein n=1 Tax=Lactobacillus apis TaxID=303541 RepID=UPI00164F1541|nr:DUF1542 domain-containing protein [Lactobacillus apis]MBC6361457.1 DUF1542 domain-containing protein [Lactobacillus apis]